MRIIYIESRERWMSKDRGKSKGFGAGLGSSVCRRVLLSGEKAHPFSFTFSLSHGKVCIGKNNNFFGKKNSASYLGLFFTYTAILKNNS